LAYVFPRLHLLGRRIKLSSAEQFAAQRTELPSREGQQQVPQSDDREKTFKILVGESQLRAIFPAIRELRSRNGQSGDFTTDPEHFIAANTQRNRRIVVVLIRHNCELEACVFFFEHCRLGIGLGLLRGGGSIGEGLFVGPHELQVQYVTSAAQALLQHWRVHGVSLAMMEPQGHCIGLMRPSTKYRQFAGEDIQRKLHLGSTYLMTLGRMGPRTRRSLAVKRRQLETRDHVKFSPWLEPAQALEAMLMLQRKSLPKRSAKFFEARYDLLSETPEFFSMGISTPQSKWLSIISGWRWGETTYVDLQMNDITFKKESISAVMRAFMLEHEISRKQKIIHFVGGTSLLLRRYCQLEPCTRAFFWRPCLRAFLFRTIIPHIKSESFYERVNAQAGESTDDHP
jgi:hypothetical protein